MKYAPALYAKALREMIQETPKSHHQELVNNFCRGVIKNGDGARSDKIITAIEEQETHAKGGKMVQMEFAREMSETVIKKLEKKFATHDLVSVRITPSLVAGVRITVDGEKELDGSLQRKLRKLFPNKLIT